MVIDLINILYLNHLSHFFFHVQFTALKYITKNTLQTFFSSYNIPSIFKFSLMTTINYNIKKGKKIFFRNFGFYLNLLLN